MEKAIFFAFVKLTFFSLCDILVKIYNVVKKYIFAT